MMYNYMRFENPFEFGQSYQLTVTDQTAYLNGIKGRFSFINWLNWCGNYFFSFSDLGKGFPWVSEHLGVFVTSPILLFGFQHWHTGNDKTAKWLRILLFISIGLIIESQLLNAPSLSVARYCMDFTFLLSVAVLFKVAYEYRKDGNGFPAAPAYGLVINYAALLSILIAFLLFFAVSDDCALVTVNQGLAHKLSYFFALQIY